MGSVISCGSCPSISDSNVINFSEDLVLRLVEGIEVPVPLEHTSTADDDWIVRIKCMDDAHTYAYGLSYKELDKYFYNLEQRVRPPPSESDNRLVMGCYRHNSECTLKCTETANMFIDNIDAKRLRRLEILMEEAKKKQGALTTKGR